MFTTTDIVNEVRRLAKAEPNFVYIDQEGRDKDSPCGYTGMGPGTSQGRACIVGQALMNLGVPAEALVDSEDSVGVLLAELEQVEYGPFDSTNEEWLTTVQGFQDEGTPWGEAVSSADLSMRAYQGRELP